MWPPLVYLLPESPIARRRNRHFLFGRDAPRVLKLHELLKEIRVFRHFITSQKAADESASALADPHDRLFLVPPFLVPSKGVLK